MKRYYTIINYCYVAFAFVDDGLFSILDDMRPKDQIPQDMLSESDLKSY
ncbi:MAG: hypothetical protein ACLT63_14835 [Bacteroides xylanisolvens]